MAYQSNKPAASDALNISQGDLQNNFSELNTAFDVNHVGFNVTDQGKHDFIHFPNQTVSGTIPPDTSSTEVGLYARAGNLYFRPVSSAIGDITNDRLLSLPLVGATSYSTTNFDGLVVKWGSSPVNSTPVDITFPIAFPNACYMVVVTPYDTTSTNNFVNVDNTKTTKTKFFCNSYTRSGSSSSCNINWIALGY